MSDPTVVRGGAEAETDRLRVTDVEEAVGLRGEPRNDGAPMFARLDIGGDDGTDEISAGGGTVRMFSHLRHRNKTVEVAARGATDFGPTKSNVGMNLRSTGRDAARRARGFLLWGAHVTTIGSRTALVILSLLGSLPAAGSQVQLAGEYVLWVTYTEG